MIVFKILWLKFKIFQQNNIEMKANLYVSGSTLFIITKTTVIRVMDNVFSHNVLWLILLKLNSCVNYSH